MRYEWDEAKNRENQRKHGVSFEQAALVFQDDCCLVYEDRIDETGEQRWHAIGAARIEQEIAVILVVVHTCKENNDDEEIIRIISAREAQKHERRRYQKQAMD